MEVLYDQGTILLQNPSSQFNLRDHGVTWDERVSQWRAPAHRYRDVIMSCHKSQIPYQDLARGYHNLPLKLHKHIEPRPHQTAALQAWVKAERMGTVCLPTGAGKTILAMMVIHHCQRPTLIVVPTIDLLHQWQEVIKTFFGMESGLLGGGTHDLKDITVTTYDSASLHFEKIGDKFGLLVFDECHHLPAPRYLRIAEGSIAPFRLGLSATVERSDGKESDVYRLIGPLVYEADIHGVIGHGLSPYDVVTVQVEMTEEEREAYQYERSIYTQYLKQQRINFSNPQAWMQFVTQASRTPAGREAMRAYRAQKKLAQASDAKLQTLWKILNDHIGERIIVFTDDNEFAYRIGSYYFLPVLTHQTKPAERKEMLAGFRSGELSVLVTSKVLNEGVDVPEASIGVVMSGSGAVREHVQRLGRVLRYKEGKRATLYEIISEGTGESSVNQRRRQHHAYQRSY